VSVYIYILCWLVSVYICISVYICMLNHICCMLNPIKQLSEHSENVGPGAVRKTKKIGYFQKKKKKKF